MKHLGSLESTQEARVALGYTSSNYYASFVLSKFPQVLHISMNACWRMNQLLNVNWGLTSEYKSNPRSNEHHLSSGTWKRNVSYELKLKEIFIFS